jgi:predicted nucleotidyltransferase
VPRQPLDPALFSPDTRDLITLLHKHHVRYLIVGGEAVIYYGHIRTTGDVDVFYDRADTNVQQLFAAVDEFWAGHIPNLDRWQELAEPGMILQFGVPPNRIDLINDISGVKFGDAWPNRLTLTMPVGDSTVEVFLIGIDDLIKNKEASGRHQDLEDLKFLCRAHPPQKPR